MYVLCEYLKVLAGGGGGGGGGGFTRVFVLFVLTLPPG